MSNSFFIYLATRLTGISLTCWVLTVVSGLIYCGMTFYRLIDLDLDSTSDWMVARVKRNARSMKFTLRFFIISLTIAVLMPTTKEAVFIYAGGKTLDYVQKDTSLQKIPYKATEIIIHKMDEYLNDSTLTK